MGLFRVIILFLNINNRLLRKGDTFPGDAVAPSELKRLLEGEKIELVEGSEAPIPTTHSETPILFIMQRDEKDHEVRSIDDISPEEIIGIMDDFNIPIEPNATKEFNFEKLMESIKEGYPHLDENQVLHMGIREFRDVLFFIEREGVQIGISSIEEISPEELVTYLTESNMEVLPDTPKELLWDAATQVLEKTSTAENDTQASKLLGALTGTLVNNPTPEPESELPVLFKFKRVDDDHEVRKPDDINKKEILVLLDDMKVAKNLQYLPNNNKEFLWNLLIQNL